ncbi:MAG: hypothetical protein WC557_11940, partial [Ignavibacteriaceae bacterium]
MKNEKFYSEFLSGLANQPDQTTSAKLIGEKIHFQLQTAVEMFISLKDDHLQIIFSQSVTTFSESELQQLLSKNEFPQEQESSTENVRSLCEILQAEHVFYLPFQIQT